MREIKFRLWQKRRKQMIYSDFDLSNNIQIYMNGSIAWNGQWITDDVEIMQFTGLYDSKKMKSMKETSLFAQML